MAQNSIGQNIAEVRRTVLLDRWAEASAGDNQASTSSDRIVKWNIDPKDRMLEESNDSCGCH